MNFELLIFGVLCYPPPILSLSPLIKSKLSEFFFPLLLCHSAPPAALVFGISPASVDQKQAELQEEKFQRIKLVFEPDAYYSEIDLIITLTKSPIPQLGEMTELEIYHTLLSRTAVLPQFVVIEASYNPMPNLGVDLKTHDQNFYDNA